MVVRELGAAGQSSSKMGKQFRKTLIQSGSWSRLMAHLRNLKFVIRTLKSTFQFDHYETHAFSLYFSTCRYCSGHGGRFSQCPGTAKSHA